MSRVALAAIVHGCAPAALAQPARAAAAPPDLSGVYQAIPNGTALPAGRKK